MTRGSGEVRGQQRVREQLRWACVIALTSGIGAVIAATRNQPIAIAVVAIGAATALWLVQTAIIGLSAGGSVQPEDSDARISGPPVGPTLA